MTSWKYIMKKDWDKISSNQTYEIHHYEYISLESLQDAIEKCLRDDMKKDINSTVKGVLELIDQKIVDIDEDHEKYGGYTPVLEAEKDLLNDIKKDIIDKYKYK